MPSPSLGFFSIAKAPSSHSQLQKTSKPCKPAQSNTLKLQNLETNSVNEARLQHAPVMMSEIVKGENCTKELSLLDVKSELSMQVDNKQMACVEVKYNSVGSGKISKQEKVENILGHVNVTYEEHGELRRNNNASRVEDAVFPRHEKKLLSESHTQVQLEKETGQHDVSLKGYQSVLQEPPSIHYHGGAADHVKNGGDAQKHLLNGNLSVNCSETTGSNLEAVNQQLQGEQLKTTSVVTVGEIMSTRESESHVNSCQVSFKCFAASEPKIAKIEGCQLSVDDQSGFIQTIPVLEQCDKVIASKAMDHSTQVFELDRSSEDCRTVSATTCNIELNNVSQEGRPFREDNVQNLLLTSQVCPMVKSDFVSGENEMSTNNHCTISKLQHRDEGSSWDASIHYDVPCYLPGNFEQQTSNITYSKVNKMLCEDVSLVLNHGDLLDQSEFSQVSANINSNTKDFIGSEAEKSSSFLQHTILTRLGREVDHSNTEIKGSHVEAQMRLLNENPAPYKSNSKHLNVFITDKFPLADNNSMNENSSLPDIQSLGAAVRADPENGNNILHSDSDWAPTNIASSEEVNKSMEDVHARSFNENPAPFNCNSKHCLVTNDTDFQRSGAVGTADLDNVNSILLDLNGDMSTHVAPSEEIEKTILFEGALCDIYTSENNDSHNHSQAMPENKDGNISTDDLPIDDAKEGYSNILPLVEFELNGNIQKMTENKDGNLDMDDIKDGSSDMFPSVQVQVNDNIQDMSENNDGNVDMDDSEECYSNISSLVEVQLIDNIQAISGNNDENLDMDYAKEGSSDTLPLVEVQLDDNIQAMYENSERNLYMDDLQMDYAKGSSDMLPLVEVQVNDNIQDVSQNNDGNLDMDDSKECSSDILPLVEVQANDNIISSERIFSSAVNKDSFADVVAWKPEERCSLSESSNLPASDHLTFNLDEFSDTDMLYQSKGGIYFAEDNRKIIDLHDSALKSNQEVLTGKLPTNAAPFSDEWFTATDSAEQKLNQNPPRGDMPETVACDTELRDAGSSRDASIQHHVNCDASKAEEMLCEYKGLEPNHDHVGDQNEFSEVSADFISNTKDSIGSGAEKPSGHIQHSLLGQFVEEFIQTNREIEESHLTTQVQTLAEHPVLYNCNSKQCLAVSDSKFPLADSDNINENSQLPDFQGPCAVVGVDSQNVDNIQLHLDGNWLSTNIVSSEEIEKTNLSENAVKGCDVRTGEYNASNDHIQTNDGNLYADERAEHLQTNNVKKGSSDILPVVEVQLKDNVVSSECNSFIEEIKDSFTDEVAWKPEEHSSSESSSCEISLLNSTTFSEEAGTNIFEKDESPNTGMEHKSKGDIYYAEDSNKIIHLQESATKSKLEVPTLKPPPNAAPFSEEWLAAIEAAGEEILTMKGGAVQNSPTEKTQHEPGPWSPVRRKNQSIGPFDCTKHNTQPSSS
ncbi:uncharacterized protein LOC114168225 isoform X1 [Vigna unguiculata]|uniref:uncharacterized protein LOC114168225 isoform X1 n=1 Tax=Vigna unguiculata TaxID=3917 RepID=UPI001016724A|nr:uncharacterized protein LOC114168225 isoform X1 [Vigna unguiculata]